MIPQYSPFPINKIKNNTLQYFNFPFPKFMNVITMGSSFPVGFSLFSHFEKITEKPLRITENPPVFTLPVL